MLAPPASFTLAYNGNQTVITDAIGNTQTLTFSNSLGINLLVSRTDSSDGKTRSRTFDSANNLTSRTDEEGRVTADYSWDSLHRLTGMTEAAGTSAERTTTLQLLDSRISTCPRRSPSLIEPPASPTGHPADDHHRFRRWQQPHPHPHLHGQGPGGRPSRARESI